MRDGRAGLIPMAASTASGNFAGCAVASVTIGTAGSAASRATFMPTAVCGQRTSPVVKKASAIVAFVFGVPLKGSFWALAAGAVVYAAATTGYGLVIATFTSSQVAAVFATAILSMMPTFLFSGFLQPVSSLEGGARVLQAPEG